MLYSHGFAAFAKLGRWGHPLRYGKSLTMPLRYEKSLTNPAWALSTFEYLNTQKCLALSTFEYLAKKLTCLTFGIYCTW